MILAGTCDNLRRPRASIISGFLFTDLTMNEEMCIIFNCSNCNVWPKIKIKNQRETIIECPICNIKAIDDNEFHIAIKNWNRINYKNSKS